ncbi:hypothetical protein [Paenibacillus mucilaginosus]|uniref:hypothetical protein n=1 Tax=Paenibacillus mucilaginosus TaxID=61624 RepID=UPI00240D1D81|nr:hypothetical protein [Paenibacillus mucilaginosus]
MKPLVFRTSASRPEERTGYEAAGFPLFGFAPGRIDGHEAAGSLLFGFAPGGTDGL